MGKCKIKNNLMWISAAVFLVFIMIYSGEVSAGVQVFENQDLDMPIVVDFENGDFEKPDLYSYIPPLSWNFTGITSPTLAEFHAQTHTWLYIPDSEIPGWNAIPYDPADAGEPFANMIELHLPDSRGDSQYIDMLGAMNQEFYQIVATTPGTNIYYSYFAGNNGLNLIFVCGDQNNPAEIRRDTMGSVWQTYSGILTANQSNTYFGFICDNGVEGRGNFVYNGVQYTNAKRTGGGVHLDDIKFQTQSKIMINKSVSTTEPEGALLGEILTYTIEVANYGQTDTSETVLTDILGEEVAFAGNVRIDGAPAGNLASFDTGTDKLTVRLGSGATAAASGSLAGTVKMNSTPGEIAIVTFDVEVVGDFGDTIRNQAAVYYDDKGFESYTMGGYVDYSNVTAVPIVNKACYAIEVNKELTEPAAEERHFVFKIDAYTPDGLTVLKTFYIEVSISAGGKKGTALVELLYSGRYQVTEINNNWNYQITDPLKLSQSVAAVDPYHPAAVDYQNERTGPGVVAANGSVVNHLEALQ